ncbi:MAG: nucleotide exchange factor GrpE [Legionella sp.]|jgi:molecular chaperone GrpE (heat shock protein)|nr:nucleotide exchange factor GrpE [Legionella sp.]
MTEPTLSDNTTQNLLQDVATRITDLQKAHVALQDTVKTSQQQLDRTIEEASLKIIDILDLLEHQKTDSSTDMLPQHTALIIKKINKRLIELLTRWHIEEIKLDEGLVKPGKTRVLETQPQTESTPSGTVLKVCRKGYQRENKILRPVDVISSV